MSELNGSAVITDSDEIIGELNAPVRTEQAPPVMGPPVMDDGFNEPVPAPVDPQPVAPLPPLQPVEITGDPIFTPPPEETEGEPAPDAPKPLKWSKEQEREAIGGFLNFTNLITATGLKMLAGEERPEWELSEKEMNQLAPFLLPFMPTVQKHVPPGLQLAGVALAIYAPKAIAANKIRQTKAENEKLLASPQMQQRITNAAAAAATEQRERTRFAVDKDGYYENGKVGGYIAKADRVEKCSIKDIENLIGANGLAKMQKIFPGVDLSQYVQDEG